MKKITFLLLTFTAISIFGQNKLTSSVEENYDGINWLSNSRTEYTYDENKNLIEEKQYEWDGTSTGAIMNTANYTYNSSNKILTEVYEEFDTSNGNSLGKYRETYTYTNGIVSLIIDQEWLDGAWKNEYRREFLINNNLITQITGSEWNGSGWVFEEDSAQVTVSYNTNNLISSTTIEIWNGTSWVPSEISTNTYNANNKLISILYKEWNGTSYLNTYKDEYVYDGNGNQISETSFNYENGVFTESYQQTYVFDNSINLESFSHPFRDRTGLGVFTNQEVSFVNKILSSSSGGSDYRTTYNYNEATVSLDDFNSIDFSVYPNPTSSVLNIDDRNFTIKNVSIFNVIGKKIVTSTKNKINLENLNKGVYILRVESNTGSIATKRIVKN
ncbi:T9SS type A sorting domain-containing protein [uncultured Polaribacter sp.]|uniref:T9SS type A sorting domain-containing protein n=1 Tax=uncultured Polaribacter sp. TaxID=174711 RepID=UPI002628C877|nr:T9SS type A sorting domain-containing protein [uncultured Polaribacter sp.]